MYLNIWTPGIDNSSRPVMVFIHGGAFLVGSANESAYDGSALARRGDVVVITVNYRLGMLGWMDLGGLDPAYSGSGNNGLRDQISALTWVNTNIAMFGGNPSNITVFGESAGSVSVSALLAVDHPERLFHRAIAQSGSGYEVHSREYANQIGTSIAEAGNFTKVDDFLDMTTDQVLALQQRIYDSGPLFSGDSLFAPFVDGDLLPDAVVPRLEAGNAINVDLMTGTNRDETKYWALYDPALLNLPPSFDLFFPDELSAERDAMTSVYRADRPGSADGDITHAMITDQLFRVPQLRLAEAQSLGRATYVYEFRWHTGEASGDPTTDLGAIHSLELPFVFGNIAGLSSYPGGSDAVANLPVELTAFSYRMMDAWLAFARTGNPNNPDSFPQWPTYNLGQRSTMVWDIPASVEDAPRDNERQLWNTFAFDTWSFTP